MPYGVDTPYDDDQESGPKRSFADEVRSFLSEWADEFRDNALKATFLLIIAIPVYIIFFLFLYFF